MTGRLYGIGLGPGDPELLTLKALRFIQSSPVVSYFAKEGRRGNARTSAQKSSPSHGAAAGFGRRSPPSLSTVLASTAMRRVLQFRDAGADDRFYDLDFRAVQADPIGQVVGLYDWLGEPVSEEFEQQMRQWWADNAEDREAAHHPDAATYGLDMSTVRPLFAEYVQRAERWTTAHRPLGAA